MIIQLCLDFFFSFSHRFLIFLKSHAFSDLLNSHTRERTHFFEKSSDTSWKTLQIMNKIIINLLQSNFCSSTVFSLRMHQKSCLNIFNVFTTMLTNSLRQENMLLYNKKKKCLFQIKNLSLKILFVLFQRMFTSD